jgi:hypothetical protein
VAREVPVAGEALADFGELVIGDAELRHELLSAGDHDRFVALVVRRARDAGFDVGPDDVEQGLRARRRAWGRGWI